MRRNDLLGGGGAFCTRDPSLSPLLPVQGFIIRRRSVFFGAFTTVVAHLLPSIVVRSLTPFGFSYEGAVQQERDRLELEKDLRIADARNTAR